MKQLFSFILIMTILSSCNLGVNGIFKSDNIESELKSEIESLNKKFIKSIVDNDRESLKSLFSSALLKDMSNPKTSKAIDEFFDLKNSFSKLHHYRVLDEFLVKSSINSLIEIPYSLTSTNDYNVTFKTLTDESYVSLVIMRFDEDLEILFCIVYGKYNDQWKINLFEAGDYSLFDHTAPYYYQKAKYEYDNGNLINAYLNIHLSEPLLRLDTQIFSYTIEKEAIELSNKIANTIQSQYNFPIILEEIDSKPQIFTIESQELERSFCPMVKYLSKVNLKDTLQLRLENEKIRKVIPQYFKGIDENDFICYQAYNELSNGDEPVTRYGFVDDLKTK